MIFALSNQLPGVYNVAGFCLPEEYLNLLRYGRGTQYEPPVDLRVLSRRGIVRIAQRGGP